MTPPCRMPRPGRRPAEARRQRVPWLAMLGRVGLALLALVGLALHAAPLPAQQPPAPAAGSGGPPPGFQRILLAAGPSRVWDGDTFDADLDGNGRLELPRERVRLLFVDTPELSDSPKGKDRAHGIPAREFLAAQLKRRPIVLDVPQARPTDIYGRTLARVLAGGEDVDLALIRAGHSYFYTRFSYPPDAASYAVYAAAEGEAFDARRGIWRDAASRRRYLERLKREHKTPAGRSNAAYVATVQDARSLDPAQFLNKYVRLEGTVAGLRRLGKDVRLLQLEGPPGQPPLAIAAFPEVAERLGLDGWPVGTRVRLEGFVHVYQQHLELLLHYGARLP